MRQVMAGLKMALLTGVLLALVAPANGCRTAEAEVRADLRVVQVGDSVKVSAVYKSQNSPDSLALLFSLRGAPSVTMKAVRPANNVSLVTGPATLVPAPFYAEGDTGTVSVCFTGFKRGVTYPNLGCVSRLFTRQVVPPVVNPDSLQLSALRVSPKNVSLAFGGGQQFCAYSTTDGGQTWAPVSNQSPSCGPTPASRLEPNRDLEMRLRSIRVALQPWFPRDSILDDPWEVYRGTQAAG